MRSKSLPGINVQSIMLVLYGKELMGWNKNVY